MRPDNVLAQAKSAYQKVDAPCPYFGTCGGCTLQDLTYADQLRLKREQIQRAFAPLSVAQPLDIELVGLEDPWRYRNKAELTFSEFKGRLELGYHARGSFWRVVDLEDCLLLPQSVAGVLRDTRALAAGTGLPAYHPKTHQGFFRYLLIRSSHATGKILACLITTSGSREVMERLAEELAARHPAISSVYWGVSNRLADVALPEALTLLWGVPQLEDQIGPFRLTLHPLSFLQPASLQADRVYTLLAREIGEVPDGVAWDLYCGVGLISFYLSRHVRKIYAIDVEPHHLELAALNASRNGLSNIECRLGRVEALLMDRRFWLQEAKPSVVVVDPPRAGLHQQAINSLLAARPARIAYLSCNVQSLVRDLQALQSGFPRYRLSMAKAFDMFPQTNHVEILVILDRT